jgi:hypothetical protein
MAKRKLELDVADVLERAADLIEPEGKWTQGAYARTVRGYCIGPNEDAAVCFCLRGALRRVGGVGDWDESSPATRALGFFTAKTMTGWNDHKKRTQAEVIAKLRETAAKARAALPPLPTVLV